MSVTWIEYKNKPILYADIRKLSGTELMQDLDNLFNIIGECPNDLVILVDEEGAYISQEYQERWKFSLNKLDLKVPPKVISKLKKYLSLVLTRLNLFYWLVICEPPVKISNHSKPKKKPKNGLSKIKPGYKTRAYFKTGSSFILPLSKNVSNSTLWMSVNKPLRNLVNPHRSGFNSL